MTGSGTKKGGGDAWITWLLAATALAAAYAAAIAATGGFTLRIGAIRLRSHSWVRPALAAAAGAAILLYFARARVAAAVASALAITRDSRFPIVLVSAAIVWSLAAGIVFGTFANGGADSYGYVGQARLLAQGRLTDTIPFSPDYPWPDVALTLTPLGFTPGQARGVIAPKYPPGLPLLLAPLAAISERAIYFFVPVCGAFLVWLTYRLGVRWGDDRAGGMGAVLLSVSPTFLYQVVQPMSDVPAAVGWLGALLLAARPSANAAAGAGALASLAILIRPNLAPLALLVGMLAAAAGSQHRVRRVVIFGTALLPGVLLLGWIQAVRYGSPTASGYGTLSDAFSASYIAENLARYPRWLTETHTSFIWLSLLAPWWMAWQAPRRPVAWMALALAAGVWAAYLPYIYFHPHEWFYTRFLLPALPVMLVGAAAVALWPLGRFAPRAQGPAAVILLAILAVACLHSAKTHGAFSIRIQERKYPLAGTFVREHLPRSAFVLAAQHSGSVRYYSGRPTLRWDLLSPTRLDEALGILRSQGFEPFLVVDAGEYEEFRSRFEAAGQQSPRALTPLAVMGDARVFAFR